MPDDNKPKIPPNEVSSTKLYNEFLEFVMCREMVFRRGRKSGDVALDRVLYCSQRYTNHLKEQKVTMKMSRNPEGQYAFKTRHHV